MLVISYFGNMPDFVNFEAVDDSNVDGIHDTEEILAESVSDVEFIDDENVYDENITDYYAFINVSRNLDDAMQNSFIAFDYSQEANNYCPEDYDPNNEIIVEFKDSAKKVDDFESTLLIPHGFENINSFYYALLYVFRYHVENKK